MCSEAHAYFDGMTSLLCYTSWRWKFCFFQNNWQVDDFLINRVSLNRNTYLGWNCFGSVRCWAHRDVYTMVTVIIFRFVSKINGLLTKKYVNVSKNKHKFDIWTCTYHQAIRRTQKCIKPNGIWMTMVRTMSGGENQHKRWHGNVWDCHEIGRLKSLEWKRKWAQ